ncbi:hypothetical protein SJAV_26540 [Sulfurisphaera javensis]|uniref:CRISPR type III-associated protein domain-containing protein n=1 Tax=Sulfurisphaera javensis TaxID=2049879 RepID=A0AAT9GV65_9CREN
MKRLLLKFKPITPYVISSSLSSEEKKVEFYFGINPKHKFIPPSTIKGFLRTAAVYSYSTESCEFISSTLMMKNGIKPFTLTCADLIDPSNYDQNIRSIIEQTKKCMQERKVRIPCIICRTFGNTKVRGKMRIVKVTVDSNNESLEGKLEEISNLLFSWQLSEENRKALTVETSKSEIKVEILCEDDECVEVIKNACEVINKGLVRLGRFKSRGFGRLTVEVEEIP